MMNYGQYCKRFSRRYTPNFDKRILWLLLFLSSFTSQAFAQRVRLSQGCRFVDQERCTRFFFRERCRTVRTVVCDRSPPPSIPSIPPGPASIPPGPAPSQAIIDQNCRIVSEQRCFRLFGRNICRSFRRTVCDAISPPPPTILPTTPAVPPGTFLLFSYPLILWFSFEDVKLTTFNLYHFY